MPQSSRSGEPCILMVAYHFAPENVSGTHRSLHFAKSLHEAGHRVLVLTVTLPHLRSTIPACVRSFHTRPASSACPTRGPSAVSTCLRSGDLIAMLRTTAPQE